MRNVSFICISGPLAGQTFPLTGGPAFIFGRYAKARFSMASDPAASHLHFLVDTSDDRIRVIDLGSTNGLIINDRHMGGKLGTPFTDFVTLKNGDVILAGSCMFRVSVEQGSAAETTVDSLDDVKSGMVAKLRPNSSKSGRLTTIIGQGEIREDIQSAQLYQESGTAPKRRGGEAENEWPDIAGFTIIGRIGGGGKGVVYKAIKSDSGATAAIKMLLSAKTGKQRSIEVFRREIRVTKQLRHPNIIRYLADGMANGLPYLALEFAGGGTLDELIASAPDKRLDLPRAVPLFIQILEAVAYMHGQLLAHRDIKPKNVLLDVRRGGSLAAKLSDMGLSCRFTNQESDEFFPIVSDGGTPAYMPPEQLLDVTKALPQSDVFSAAATFYQMLTGSLLYDFTDRDQREAIVEGRITPIQQLRPDLPPGLVTVVTKALSYNPELRYANAQEMLDVLKRALD